MTTVAVGPRANTALLGSCHRDVGQGPVWVPLLRWSQQRPNRREMWQKETSVAAGLAGSRRLRGGGLSPQWEVRHIECVGPVRCLYKAVKQAVRPVSRGLVVAQRTGCSWTWSLQCGSRSHSRGTGRGCWCASTPAQGAQGKPLIFSTNLYLLSQGYLCLKGTYCSSSISPSCP